MLNKKAFAKALAVLTGTSYLVFYLLNLVAPRAFVFLFNAQFFGADVASLIPLTSFSSFLGTLVVVSASGWVVGYFCAWLYDTFS